MFLRFRHYFMFYLGVLLLLLFFFPVLGWFLFCNYGFCVELAEAKLDLYLYGWLKVGKVFTEILSTLSPQNLFVSTEINSIESLWFSKNVSLLNQTRHFSGVQIWEKRFSVKSWLWLVSILCTSSVIVFFFSPNFLCGKDVHGCPENCLGKEKFCFWIWKQ